MPVNRPHGHRFSIVGVAVLWLALLWTLSASAEPVEQTPSFGEIQITEKDDGRQIDLQGGEWLTVRLEANLAAGYLWEWAPALAEGRAVLQQVGEAQFELGSQAMAAGEVLLGAPNIQTLRFQAIEAGQASLDLIYRRPWEADPIKRMAIQVRAIAPSQLDRDLFSDPATVNVMGASFEEAPLVGLPAAFDWCAQGKCTAVRDQGSCGSCWAFGTVGVLESNILMADGATRNLSEQYLVSCNINDWSCSGGWWAHDYHHTLIPPGESAAGAVYEASFPYSASDESCNGPTHPQPHPHHEKIISWHYVGNSVSIPSIAAIKQAIYDHGPVAVALCTGPAFGRYTGGLFNTNESAVCNGGINHAVVLVGWDDAQNAWRLRNSWGAGWGEGGYMNIRYGVSNVGYAANYVVYGGGGCPDAFEPNDSYDTASQIQVGISQAHNFHGNNDVDWSRFIAQASSTYTLTTYNLSDGNDTVLELYAPDGATRLEVNDDCPGMGWASCINGWTAPATATYYIRTFNYSDQGGCSGYDYTLQVATAWGDRNSAIHLPILNKPGCRQVQIVQNGDFESGSVAWVQSSGPYAIIGNYFPHGGSWGAWFGGYDNADDRLYQTITFPAGASSARLTLYLYVYTTEGGAYPYDYFHVELQDEAGQTLETFLWADNRMASSEWYIGTKTWQNLGAHAGRTRRLLLQGTTDYSLFTNFFVDDIALTTYCGQISDTATEDGVWQAVEGLSMGDLEGSFLAR